MHVDGDSLVESIERAASGVQCRRMSRRCSGPVQVVRLVSFGRLLTRNAVTRQVYHTSASGDDKSPLSLRLISRCSQLGTQASVLHPRKLIATLALSLRRYCCKKQLDDDNMSASKRDPASEQLNDYKRNVKVIFVSSSNDTFRSRFLVFHPSVCFFSLFGVCPVDFYYCRVGLDR